MHKVTRLSLIGFSAVLLLNSARLSAQQMDNTQAAPAPGTTLSPMGINQMTSDNSDRERVSIADVQDRHERKMDLIWYSSMLAVAAGSAFDSASSWHKGEANSLLASKNGTFGAKAASIKVGLLVGTLLPQILLRKNKDLRTGFTIANLAVAGVFAGVGIHNLTISSPKTQASVRGSGSAY